MPEIAENIEKNRFNEVKRRCIPGARLWLDLGLAAQSGDAPECKRIYEQMRKLTVEVSDFLKAHGGGNAVS